MLLIAFASEGLYLLDSSGYAQERGTRYFSETGHNLEGAFFNYFQDKGGLEIFGYPITEGFQEDGFFVQYFERARLVLTGSRGKRASGSEEVKVAPLGELLGRRSPPFKPTYHFHYRYYPQNRPYSLLRHPRLLRGPRRRGALRLSYYRAIFREGSHRPIFPAGPHGVASR